MEVEESLLVGNFKIVRDTEDYSFTSDSVLLSRFVKAKKGERVADFCAGCGIVGLHFLAENKGVEETVFFEMREKAASLCEKSVRLNALENKCRVECVRVQDIPKSYVEHFSLILCNPPYFQGGILSPVSHRALSMSDTALPPSELFDAAKRCLKFGGRFAFIHAAGRLTDLICGLKERNLEPKKLQFVAGERERKPYAVLILAVKGGRSGLEVLPTLINKKEKSHD